MKIGNNWLTSLVTVTVLVIMASGASFSFHDMTEDGQMTGCPMMMDQDVICSMSVQEHISAWQSMFAAISPQNIFLAVLLLLLVPILFKYLLYKPPSLLSFQSKEKFTPIFNHLQEAFSSGLIHSKAY